MSENTGIQITGLSAFASSLSRVQTDTLTCLKQGLISAAEEVIAESVQITPVDTGEKIGQSHVGNNILVTEIIA